MNSCIDLNQLSEEQLRHLVAQMLATLDEQSAALSEEDMVLNEKDAALHARDEMMYQYPVCNDHLTHEIAPLRRHTYGKRSEAGGGC